MASEPMKDSLAKVTSIWAEEPGISLVTSPAPDGESGLIRFEVRRMPEDAILARATIARFRWKHIIRALGGDADLVALRARVAELEGLLRSADDLAPFGGLGGQDAIEAWEIRREEALRGGAQ